jgi:hypothetical protein
MLKLIQRLGQNIVDYTEERIVEFIRQKNKKREIYMEAAKQLFGILSIFFLLFTLYQ